MTIEELYKWAVKNDVEDCDITARDWNGSYINVMSANIDLEVNKKRKEVFIL